MSQNEVERNLGRIITDRNFRLRVTKKFVSTCVGEGVALAPEEMALLREVDLLMFEQITEAIDSSLRRS